MPRVQFPIHSNPFGTEQTAWRVTWRRGSQERSTRRFPENFREGVIAYVPKGKSGSLRPTVAKAQATDCRGQNHSEERSPDGSQLVFVSTRGDHSFRCHDIAAKSVRFLAPSVDPDSDPVWSLDGKRIAFVRRPAEPRDTPAATFFSR